MRRSFNRDENEGLRIRDPCHENPVKIIVEIPDLEEGLKKLFETEQCQDFLAAVRGTYRRTRPTQVDMPRTVFFDTLSDQMNVVSTMYASVLDSLSDVPPDERSEFRTMLHNLRTVFVSHVNQRTDPDFAHDDDTDDDDTDDDDTDDDDHFPNGSDEDDDGTDTDDDGTDTDDDGADTDDDGTDTDDDGTDTDDDDDDSISLSSASTTTDDDDDDSTEELEEELEVDSEPELPTESASTSTATATSSTTTGASCCDDRCPQCGQRRAGKIKSTARNTGSTTRRRL